MNFLQGQFRYDLKGLRFDTDSEVPGRRDQDSWECFFCAAQSAVCHIRVLNLQIEIPFRTPYEGTGLSLPDQQVSKTGGGQSVFDIRKRRRKRSTGDDIRKTQADPLILCKHASL